MYIVHLHVLCDNNSKQGNTIQHNTMTYVHVHYVCPSLSFSPHLSQRRDYRVLARFLPPKQEFVLSIRLSPVQEKLYTRYLGNPSGQHTASDLFSTFSNLQKVILPANFVDVPYN